jgi:hypothetical protein
MSGDPLFKPLLANFALFATPLFLWPLMVRDEVDLILPSRSGSLSHHECNFVGEADEVDKKEARRKAILNT